MAEFVGGFIDENVIAQLLKRSNIYGNKDKTVDDIHFMNSRNAWVRIISSVNLLNEQGTYTSKPAQNFILSNLVSLKENFKEVTEEGRTVNKLDSLSPVLSSGIDFTDRDATKAYNYSSALGVRPRPGITSFSVISKQRFGTIREANVAFSVWSVEDLDAIERLYFAPGYTCIVEWGHTVYVDNDGKIQTDTSEANKSLLDYFNDSKSQQDIAGILKDKTEKTDYNYQSFFGIIKNFSWSFRPDGGYDCSVSIISQGEVLQSLSMNVDNAGTTSQAVEAEEAKDQELEIYNKNLIYRFLGDLRANPSESLVIRDLDKMSKRVRAALDTYVISGDIKELLTPDRSIARFFKRSNLVNKGKYIAIQKSDKTLQDGKYYYFTLRTLLQLINKGFIIKDENCKEVAGFSIQSEEQYFTFKEQISLDPRICMLPKEVRFRIKQLSGESVIKTIDLQDIIELPKVLSYQASIHNKRILDILITDILVQRALETAGDNVFNFINFILTEISSALGGINEFVISETQDDFQLEIKDVGVTPSKTTFLKGVLPTVPLSGLKSILTDLNIQSKISKDLVAMISIAAQSGPTSTGEDTISMTRWNEGRVDRFLGEKSQDGCFADESTTEPVEPQPGFFTRIGIKLKYLWEALFRNDKPVAKQKFYDLLYQGYNALFFPVNPNSTQPLPGNYLDGVFKVVKNKGTSLFKILIYGKSPAQIEEKEELTVSKGVIPVELSFKTDGIGGLKIGQAFVVTSGVLPTRYDDFGYIITGIEHVIENNRWYTNVKSQLFIIKDRDLESNNFTGEVAENTLPELKPLDIAEVGVGEALADLVGLGENSSNAERYKEAKVTVEQYLGSSISDLEFERLIRTVAGETSPGARFAAENAAITSVILNRVLSPRYPNSITQVISEPRQFQAVTGTSVKPGPSQVFINPSNTVVSNIVSSIVSLLKDYKAKGWLNFTSNQDSAYKGGTDIQFKITAINTPGSQVLGNTVFFTLNNISNEPSAKQRQQRGSSGASGTL